jgi:hypothetical protein
MNEAQLLREIVGGKPVYCKVCTVDKIDEFTCDVTPIVNEEAPIPKVRLKAHLQGDNGIIIRPKKDSFVLVAFLTPTDAFVVMNDEVDQVSIKIDDTSLVMDKDHIKMNDGSLKGLTKIEKLVERLNVIEDAHNNLLAEYKTHIHSNGNNGAPTGTLNPPTGSTQQTIEKSKQDDLENTKITHG